MSETHATSREKILVEIDAEIRELIPTFLENRRKDIARVRDAVQRDEFEAIRVIGHSMKGSGGGYGFDRISEIGRSIEVAARARDGAVALDEITALESYLECVHIVFV